MDQAYTRGRTLLTRCTGTGRTEDAWRWSTAVACRCRGRTGRTRSTPTPGRCLPEPAATLPPTRAPGLMLGGQPAACTGGGARRAPQLRDPSSRSDDARDAGRSRYGTARAAEGMASWHRSAVTTLAPVFRRRRHVRRHRGDRWRAASGGRCCSGERPGPSRRASTRLISARDRTTSGNELHLQRGVQLPGPPGGLSAETEKPLRGNGAGRSWAAVSSHVPAFETGSSELSVLGGRVARGRDVPDSAQRTPRGTYRRTSRYCCAVPGVSGRGPDRRLLGRPGSAHITAGAGRAYRPRWPVCPERRPAGRDRARGPCTP